MQLFIHSRYGHMLNKNLWTTFKSWNCKTAGLILSLQRRDIKKEWTRLLKKWESIQNSCKNKMKRKWERSLRKRDGARKLKRNHWLNNNKKLKRKRRDLETFMIVWCSISAKFNMVSMDRISHLNRLHSSLM